MPLGQAGWDGRVRPHAFIALDQGHGRTLASCWHVSDQRHNLSVSSRHKRPASEPLPGRLPHTTIRRSTNLRLFKPVWSPDGHKLLAGCYDVQAGVDQLCVMNANGRNLHVIISGTPEEPVNLPAWGPHPPTH
jgi:hypothetical protein